jgi:hypothetical protein
MSLSYFRMRLALYWLGAAVRVADGLLRNQRRAGRMG